MVSGVYADLCSNEGKCPLRALGGGGWEGSGTTQSEGEGQPFPQSEGSAEILQNTSTNFYSVLLFHPNVANTS